VEKSTGMEWACKVVQLAGLSQRSIEALQQEVAILEIMDHPHIVRLHECYEEAGVLYIITELCSGGELLDHVAAQQQARALASRKEAPGLDSERVLSAVQLLRVMVQAVRYCHDHGVVHSDLKLENFVKSSLGEDGVLKLIDFGVSTFKQQARGVRGGSLIYMAPEQLRETDNPASKSASTASDVWSLGVVAYYLLSGNPPFDADTNEGIKKRILGGSLRFTAPRGFWEGIPDAAHFVKALLAEDPHGRLTVGQILEHPWLVTTSAESTSRKGKLSKDGAAKCTAADADRPLTLAHLTLRRLMAFREEGLLKRLALLAIALSLNQSELAPAQRVFLELVEDKASLSSVALSRAIRDEISSGVSLPFELPELSPEMMKLFPELPCAQLNLGYSEFVAAMMERAVSLHEPLLRKAFALLDQDNDGFITAGDMYLLLGDNAEGINLREIISEADFDHAGLVPWEHFLHMMLGTTPDFGDPMVLLADCTEVREKVNMMFQLETR